MTAAAQATARLNQLRSPLYAAVRSPAAGHVIDLGNFVLLDNTPLPPIAPRSPLPFLLPPNEAVHRPPTWGDRLKQGSLYLSNVAGWMSASVGLYELAVGSVDPRQCDNSNTCPQLAAFWVVTTLTAASLGYFTSVTEYRHVVDKVKQLLGKCAPPVLFARDDRAAEQLHSAMDEAIDDLDELRLTQLRQHPQLDQVVQDFGRSMLARACGKLKDARRHGATSDRAIAIIVQLLDAGAVPTQQTLYAIVVDGDAMLVERTLHNVPEMQRSVWLTLTFGPKHQTLSAIASESGHTQVVDYLHRQMLRPMASVIL